MQSVCCVSQLTMDDGTTRQAVGDSDAVVEQHAVAHVVGQGGQLGVAAASSTGGPSARQPQLKGVAAEQAEHLRTSPYGARSTWAEDRTPFDSSLEQHSTDRVKGRSVEMLRGVGTAEQQAVLTWCWCRGLPQKPSVPPGPGRSRSSPQPSTRGQCCRADRCGAVSVREPLMQHRQQNQHMHRHEARD